MQHYNISEATDAASALSDSRSWGCLRLLRSPPRSPSVRSVSKRAHSARHRSSGDIPTPGTTTMPGMGTSTNTGELPSVTITLTVVGIRTGRALIATIMERTAAATRMAARGTVTIMAPETIAAGTARKGIAMAARRTTRVTITAMGMRMARAVMPTASRPRTCSVSRSGRTPRRPARRASPWRTSDGSGTRDIPRPWPEARSQLRRDERSQSLVLAARRLPSPAERAGLRGRIRALRGQRGRRRGALALPRPQDGALRADPASRAERRTHRRGVGPSRPQARLGEQAHLRSRAHPEHALRSHQPPLRRGADEGAAQQFRRRARRQRRFHSPQGISTDATASSRGVAALIKQIKAEGIRAVFVENMTNQRIIEQIAKETGVKIGGTLYSDALS